MEQLNMTVLFLGAVIEWPDSLLGLLPTAQFRLGGHCNTAEISASGLVFCKRKINGKHTQFGIGKNKSNTCNKEYYVVFLWSFELSLSLNAFCEKIAMNKIEYVHSQKGYLPWILTAFWLFNRYEISIPCAKNIENNLQQNIFFDVDVRYQQSGQYVPKRWKWFFQWTLFLTRQWKEIVGSWPAKWKQTLE